MPEAARAERRWAGVPTRADRALAEVGLARSRSHASELIASSRVQVDGVVVTKAGVKVHEGALLEVTGGDDYVSRGAHKLVAALDSFNINPAGRLALDLGASTGGFTQVLLERNARKVLAVDVGHDQLADQIRADSRVRVVEGCNARNLDSEELSRLTDVNEAPSLVVADLSFISLTLVLPAISRCASTDADLALLIKPQFEVGRVRGGVVTDPAQWREAIHKVLDAASQCGLEPWGLALSPIAGSEGNREFLVHFVRGETADPREWEERVRELCARAAAKGEGSPV
ncbi:TlyA family RNA methyltransferase [Leucobacter denitrificans]|uniref:TlyA family RNA methyltransferase n=1 Tax=Leucobacter denitrificans TaxID=683042 RepID=UPI001FED1648|nr:TlyA family RNA methyltransferase [Leucobacter denitrificans]